ncbi:MAG: NAD(P)-dependent oxidoreductase [Gammaproteobacteria bacterium]|nr:MAG: NAD(P)-dependent oxidoreductase [Gammaproteobacteria bacterium]TLZ05605.1 MAG: NAD(P)-dependent oxidoreductase [Gammaproteobacteria bacterium]TLZ40931.1 MAG: NAD(P)-dependent oxidoreductase [Gammaproteobacteria bacterium]
MRVGFVGLGAMGMHMARNLHRAGMLAAVWNRSAAKARTLASELNVASPATLEQLAASTDAVVSCVSADADVLEVARGLAPGVKSGALLLDCSTIGAESARQAAALLAPRGVEFLDCPVSGGVEGARDAQLAIMAGGTPAGFARALPILSVLGRTITHFGPTGSGQAAKATNQIMCAGIIEAVAEAMAFARAQGLPLEKLIDTLGQGAGSSWYFVHRAPNMVRGSYPAGFRVRLHEKDLGICRDMAARFGVALPLVERMLAEYAELVARGYGDEDISATYRLKAELFERTNIMGAPARGT